MRFGPNRAPVLSATPSVLTVQVPNGQPLGPTIVSVDGVGGPTSYTVAGSKIGYLPPSPVAVCNCGCGCDTCGCNDPYLTICVSQPAYLGADLGGESGDVYGERGEFYQSVTDLSIPGRPGAAKAVQFTIHRQYRSAVNSTGPLGANWDNNYFENLKTEIDGSIVHRNGYGRYDRYLLNNQGAFVAPAELFAQLTQTNNGYTLRYQDGTVKQFSPTGQLQQIADRNGNTLEFGYNTQGQLTR